MGSLCVTFSGGTPATERTDYYGGNIAWITSGDLNQRRIREVDGRITLSGLDSSSAKMVKKGSILVAMYGATAGVVAVTEIEAAINQAVLAVIPKGVDSGFLFHYLSSQKNSVVAEFRQGGQPNLSGATIRQIRVPLPPAQEQRGIAAALSDADALIESLEALIEKRLAIRVASMQELLVGRKRLDGFVSPWQTKKLGDLTFSFVGGSTPPRDHPEFFRGEIPWLTIGDLNFGLVTKTAERISQAGAQRANLRILPVGTFVLSIIGQEAETTRGRCGLLGVDATISQSCLAILACEALDARFLLYWYSLKGSALALQYCQGTKQQNFNASVVASLPIHFPSDVEEQRAIVGLLSEIDAEISALQERLRKVRSLKQGMMQVLLTGKVRLVAPEVTA